ncbi:MAG: winged helix-turn-helix transcriptional regulator [Sphingobacteriaceae bacterium]|nr:winged helix-turn-helix transcriptional regulator [Sphingobacteriaceae bacterium]
MLALIFASIYLQIVKARRDVFQAIADPTRRDILNLIAAQPYHVNAIADKFDITRQAISLHLKILVDCGLIAIKQEGRNRFCEARLEQLDEVAAWVEQSKKLWVRRFEKLDNYLAEIKTKDHGKK